MAHDYRYHTYILANHIGGTIYIGVTNDLMRRVSEHRDGAASTFTKSHKIKRLVWYEAHTDINEAIKREKRLKKWPRRWKIALIEENNPDWLDLFPSTMGTEVTGSPGQPV